MTRTRRIARRLVDPAVAAAFAIGYVALLLATTSDLGYARDEGFYFSAADHYGAWFRELWQDPAHALEPSVVDRYWRANHEHPAFVKSLFALSNQVLYRDLGLFSESGTSYRFPAMVLSGLALAVVYLWGRHAVSRPAGFVAACSLGFMPRVFYHSHLDCFDMPVLSMWLITTYAYWLSLRRGGVGWALASGLLYGLLLNTKHNAWLLPPALVVHWLLTRGLRGLRRDLTVGWTGLPLGLLCMATLGPVVFVSTWPWLWNDTAQRFVNYVGFHTGHAYYNMEFLGVTYFEPPMPRGYAWVMTVATVPAVTLVLFAIGLFQSGRENFWPRLRGLARRFGKHSGSTSASHGALDAPTYSTRTLWLLCLLTSYAPWWSSGTPIFGGTKHWITAYPYLALFAAVGFQQIRGLLDRELRARPKLVRRSAQALAVSSVVLGPIIMSLHSHPWGLTAYTPLVGGAPGAASLGLNRSFWGYTTGAVVDFINERAPRGGSVYIHDTAMESWRKLIEDGRVRADLHGTLSLHASDLAIYHHEQHMARVDHQIWVDYGTVAPGRVGAYDGVPVVWVYVRPGRTRSR